MRNFFRNGSLAILVIFLFAGIANAASIIDAPHKVSDVYHWHITPAPHIVIPYAPVGPVVDAPAASVADALKEFKHISKSERKDRIKEAKAQLKEFKKQKYSSSEGSTNQVLLVILAILLPPLAVYLHEGEINSKFWIDLLLTLLFFLPGVIYALVVVLGKA
ncbi:MAG: YqaE/Pmp3 family membrane protein [Ferruginibacter sp.]